MYSERYLTGPRRLRAFLFAEEEEEGFSLLWVYLGMKTLKALCTETIS